MNQQAIIYFAIGPVQDFIASARTARDLWAGSRLLSYLSQQAQDYLLNSAKPIYPNRFIPKSENYLVSSFPNKFSVLVEGNLTEAETLAKQTEQFVRAEWTKVATAVHSELQKLVPASWSGWDKLWDKQISGLLEIYWVCTNVVEGEQQAARQEAAALLDARKRLRYFSNYEGDNREKDTLDGLLEQLGPRQNEAETTRREGVHQFWKAFQEAVNGRQAKNVIARLSRNERLSAVNLVKRFAWDYFFRQELISKFDGSKQAAHLPIPSTADIAIAAWRDQLRQLMRIDGELVNALSSFLSNKDLLDFLESTGENFSRPNLGLTERLQELDGRYFYPEFYDIEPDTELTSEAEKQEQSKTRVAAKKALSAFNDFLKGKAYPTLGYPPRYFAVLRLDGDQMGTRVAESENPAGISDLLSEYAKKVREITESNLGKVIYTGGDDALVLLPCENLLGCATKLQQAYLSLGLPLLSGEPATVSMGAAIAHYKYPLQKTLLAAQEAQNRAKTPNIYDRDALAITVLKRSGETIETGSNWQIDTSPVFQTLDELRQNFYTGRISSRLPYRLRQETFSLLSTKLPPDLREPLLSEFKWVYGRHINMKVLEQEAQQQLVIAGLEPNSESLKERVNLLFRDLNSLQVRLEEIARFGEFEDFCNLLLTSAFLAREWEEKV